MSKLGDENDHMVHTVDTGRYTIHTSCRFRKFCAKPLCKLIVLFLQVIIVNVVLQDKHVRSNDTVDHILCSVISLYCYTIAYYLQLPIYMKYLLMHGQSFNEFIFPSLFRYQPFHRLSFRPNFSLPR